MLLHTDDMPVAGHNVGRIQKLKQELGKSFSMKDLGLARKIFGMQIIRDKKAKKLWLSQEKYIQKVLQRLNMDKANDVNIPLTIHSN